MKIPSTYTYYTVPRQMFDNILSLRMVKNADDDLVVAAMHSAEAEVMEFREPQVGADSGLPPTRHNTPINKQTNKQRPASV